MNDDTVLVDRDGRGVATVTLNRPDVHNAFDDALIARLDAVWADLGSDPSVRAVVLAGAGRSFSAGADLNWMRRMAGYDREQNVADAVRLAGMLRGLATLPRPTLARVQGAALGGGAGLVACCDMAVAGPRARFGFTEVRLGLIPAAISPFVIRAIGTRHARRLFLTGERFDAAEALRVGLVDATVAEEALDDEVSQRIDLLLGNAPEALADAKALVDDVAGRPLDDALLEMTATRIADRRASAEGREGLAAFLEKREPDWR